MPLNREALLGLPFDERSHRYEARDTILYALSVGMGSDPQDERELRFVFERDLVTMPTMATILASPAPWLHHAEAGLTWRKVLNGEQSVTLHRPLAPTGDVLAQTTIEQIVDKGPDGGAIIYLARVIREVSSSEPVATVRQTLLCRADGGFSGQIESARPRRQMPLRRPDRTADLATLPQQALLYRLNGDLNPLHADPAMSRKLGYIAPILHGQCTLGIAARALLQTSFDYRATNLRSIGARFSAPVYPGETIRFEFWEEEDGETRFIGKVLARDAVVLADGYAQAA